MRFTRVAKTAAFAWLGLAPTAMAALGISCITAIDSMSRVPGLLIEHLRQEVCGFGCEPKLDQWAHRLKTEILSDLVDDGARYCDAAEIKNDFLAFLDDIYDTTVRKCESTVHDNHLCTTDTTMQPFIDCVNRAARPAVLKSLPRVARFMSDERCRKGAEYFTGDQLWEHDFRVRIKPYVHQCREL